MIRVQAGRQHHNMHQLQPVQVYSAQQRHETVLGTSNRFGDGIRHLVLILRSFVLKLHQVGECSQANEMHYVVFTVDCYISAVRPGTSDFNKRALSITLFVWDVSAEYRTHNSSISSLLTNCVVICMATDAHNLNLVVYYGMLEGAMGQFFPLDGISRAGHHKGDLID